MSPILSYSKLHLLKSCTWKFWCRYALKLPDTSNDGALRGNICHDIFELLLLDKHRKLYLELLNYPDDLENHPLLSKLVNQKMLNYGIGEFDNKGHDNRGMIFDMLFVGIQTDFLCEGHTLAAPEKEIDYKNEKMGYHIRGFIDKLSYCNDKAYIWDYKTSARKFEGEDASNNLQSLMYALYIKRVEKLDSIVRFMFLRFEDDPIMEYQPSEEDLAGFEYYLSWVTKKLKHFDHDMALSGLASDEGFPPKDSGFWGKLMCGKAHYPGHKKANGELYFHCPYKFPFYYWAKVDKSGKTLKTAHDIMDIGELKEGQDIVRKHYSGCPAFKKYNKQI